MVICLTKIKEIIEVRKEQFVVFFLCDYCGLLSSERKSHFDRKKRHYCNKKCYSLARKHLWEKEEQHAYKGGGIPENEKKKRIKARSDLNHAVRDGHVLKLPCRDCNCEVVEAHHPNYDKPFDVIWLCKKCHWEEHRRVYEHPELLESKE